LPTYVQVNAPKFFKIQASSLEELSLPKGFWPKDFLWVVSTGEINEQQIKNYYATTQSGVDLTHIRVEVEQKRDQRTRTDISLNMALDEQVRRAVEYLQHQLGKENLDRDVLVSVAVDLCKRGQQG